MADLISLVRFKSVLEGIADPSAPDPKDSSYVAAIGAASQLVRSYTGLKFESAGDNPVATTRQFQYDGSGYLDIDEAISVSGITYQAYAADSPVWTVGPYDWGAFPLNFPVKLWLELPYGSFGMSPEMGFKFNLDTVGFYPIRPSIITVTAVWGWPYIPEDVQQAVAWTAANMVETTKPYISESIEGYSRTRGGAEDADPIPERAQIALAPYIIPRI